MLFVSSELNKSSLILNYIFEYDGSIQQRGTNLHGFRFRNQYFFSSYLTNNKFGTKDTLKKRESVGGTTRGKEDNGERRIKLV